MKNEITTIDEKWKIINKEELKLNNWTIAKKWKIIYNELMEVLAHYLLSLIKNFENSWIYI